MLTAYGVMPGTAISPTTGILEPPRQLWPLLVDPAADRVVALFFEAIGLAATGRPPYAHGAWAHDGLGVVDGGPARRIRYPPARRG